MTTLRIDKIKYRVYRWRLGWPIRYHTDYVIGHEFYVDGIHCDVMCKPAKLTDWDRLLETVVLKRRWPYKPNRIFRVKGEDVCYD